MTIHYGVRGWRPACGLRVAQVQSQTLATKDVTCRACVFTVAFRVRWYEGRHRADRAWPLR